MYFSTKPLAIYFGDKLPAECHTWSMLFPFLGFPSWFEERTVYNKYIESAPSLFKPTSLAECDIAVLPYAYLSEEHVSYRHQQLFIDDAANKGKLVIANVSGDTYQAVSYPNVIALRHELYQSRKTKYEYQITQWTQDLKTHNDGRDWEAVTKTVKPKISFCGYATPLGLDTFSSLKPLLRHWLEQVPYVNKYIKPRFSYRVNALKLLLSDKSVDCDFIIRRTFAFGKYGEIDLKLTNPNRIQFIENMYNSPYALCARGGANCSLRLYEALSCGRIPVIVDSDCVLPFNDLINWSDYAIIVPYQKLQLIGSILNSFHASISSNDFVNRQALCRNLWDEWVSTNGFYSKFNFVLRNLLCL